MSLQLALVGVWFFIVIMFALILLPFRWKDPSLGATVGHLMSWGGRLVMGWRLRVENARILDNAQPCIYVGNHQSNMDVITIGAVFPRRTVAIGKAELNRILFFRRVFTGTGMIMIDRSDRAKAVAGLEEAREALLTKGHSIWIFPEGTRNKGRGLLPFKKGAFHMAVASQVPIVAVVQQQLKSYFDYEAGRVVSGEILIRVLEPIPTRGLKVDDIPRLMADVRGRIVAELAKPEMKPTPGGQIALDFP